MLSALILSFTLVAGRPNRSLDCGQSKHSTRKIMLLCITAWDSRSYLPVTLVHRKVVKASQVTCPSGEQQTALALWPYLADGHSSERKLCTVYLESFLEFCWNSWEVLNGECLLLQCWETALGGGMDEGGGGGEGPGRRYRWGGEEVRGRGGCEGEGGVPIRLLPFCLLKSKNGILPTHLKKFFKSF